MSLKPFSIRLDASTACQLRCPSCPTALGKIQKTVGTGLLKFQTFKEIVDRNPFVCDIELSNWGEIFLNPDLSRIAEYAYQKNVILRADNGVNLNDADDKTLEALVKYRFNSMNCSIDGASQEAYSIYRVRGDFEKVIGNIKKINAYKQKYRSDFPKLTWQFVAFGHNEHEIKSAKEMARQLGMKFWLKLAWEDLYTENSFSPVKNKELIREESGVGASSRKEYSEKYHDNYIKGICNQLWIQPQINYDGKVLGCCVNHWGDFGTAEKGALEPVLNSEKINYARQMLTGKKETRADIPCASCKIYLEMKENGNWINENPLMSIKKQDRFKVAWSRTRFAGFLSGIFKK